MGLPPPGARDDRNGVIYVGLCYVFWGVAPLYWRLLGDLPPLEVAVHRVLWCAVFALMTTVARGHLFRALGVVRDPRTLATLA